MTSAIATKFDNLEFIKVIQSFNPNGGINIGTLFHHAKETGVWVDPKIISKAAAIDDAKDIRNGRLFAEANRGSLLFIAETGDVLKFGAEGWVRGLLGEAERAAKDVIASMRVEACELFKITHDDPKAKELNKHADYSSTAQRIQAMIDLAKSEEGMSARISAFDADPNLLGVRNGVLNLKTKALMKVKPDLRVSMRANILFDQDANCPTWIQFIEDIQPDPDIQRMLQQLAGIFLCGDSNLQKLIFLYGGGANGKSTFIELIAWLLGDYTKRIATEMLMQHQRSPQGPSPDIVSLKGRRLVYCNEVEEGRHLAEARVKELTGGDTLSGRVPYAKEDISFQPSHKLVMVGNHQPEIHDMSHGMWRRMLLIPFDVIVPDNKRDPYLLEKLKCEGSGILNWALVGYHNYLKNGLQVPNVISDATNAYKDEQDLIGEWINDHCKTVVGVLTPKGDVYRAYHYWARKRGQFPLAQGRFIKRLSDKGYKLDAGRRNVTGIELNTEGRQASISFIN